MSHDVLSDKKESRRLGHCCLNKINAIIALEIHFVCLSAVHVYIPLKPRRHYCFEMFILQYDIACLLSLYNHRL